MSAAHDAVAGLTGELVAELVEKVPPEDPEYDILGSQVAAAQEPVEAAERSNSEEAAVAQEDVQETAHEDVPNYTPEIPEDLLAELDEPDFEAEAAMEAEPAEGEEYLYDEGDSEERKLRIAAEKRAAWLEGRLQEQNRGKWEAEAKKFFPLSEHALPNVKADSRRAFLREAKKAHEAVLPYVKPLIDKLSATVEQAQEKGLADGKQAAKEAWGTPTTGPGVVPVKTSADQAELEEARKTRNLSKIIGVLMKQDDK